MREIFSKLLGSLKRENKKAKKRTAASKGHLNNMPEHVLYGEDSGAIDQEDQENRLE